MRIIRNIAAVVGRIVRNKGEQRMSIAEAWTRIVAWHETNTPDDRFKLHGGASPEEIEEFERTIDVLLPDDVRESFLLHNGSDFWVL